MLPAADKKREGTGCPVPSRKRRLLAEVAVEQTLEGLAVAGFVAGHLVHGVMASISTSRPSASVLRIWMVLPSIEPMTSPGR